MKNLLTKISVATLSLSFIFLGSSVARAQWVAPTGIPPVDNTPAPVNVGPFDQEKSGWLGSNNLFGNKRVGGARVAATAFCLDQGTDASLVKNWTKRSNVKYNFLNGTALPTDNYSLTDPSVGILDCITAWPTGGTTGTNIPGDDNYDTLYWENGAWVNNNPNQGLRTNGDQVRVGSTIFDSNTLPSPGIPWTGDVQNGGYVNTPGIFDQTKFGVNGDSIFAGRTLTVGDTFFLGNTETKGNAVIEGNAHIASDSGSKVRIGPNAPGGGYLFSVGGDSILEGSVTINQAGNSNALLNINDGTGPGNTNDVLTNIGGGVAKWLPAQGGMNQGTPSTYPPTGESPNDTLYWDGVMWVSDGNLAADGTRVRVGPMGMGGNYSTVRFGVSGLSAFDGNIIGGQDINVVGGSHFSQNTGAQTTVGSQQNFPPNIKFGVTGGAVRIDDGTATPGYVLTSSDASGTAYWAAPAIPSSGTGGTTIANGNLNDTLRWNGSVWEPSSNLSNDTNRVVVGASMPGMPSSSKFQVNKEGDSTANDWYAHPFALQGTDQTLYAGVDSNSLRRSSYLQSAGGSPRVANGLLLNPLGGNVRIGSGAAQSFPTGGIPLSGSFAAPGTNNIYPSEFSNIKLGVTGSAMFRGPLWILDGNQGLGKVLTSNADGLAEWQPGLPIGTTTNSGQTLVWNNTTNTWEFSDLDVGPVVEAGDANDTLRWDGTNWAKSNFMNNDDTTVSITRQGLNFITFGQTPSEIFSAKGTGFTFGDSEKGLRVYETGTTETNGLLVNGSESVQGNLTVGSDATNKLTNLFGKLKVKVNTGTIAEFIGAGDFRIKSGANAGEVTVGAGTQNGIPFRVDGNVYAQVPGNPNITTQFQYVPAQAFPCSTSDVVRNVNIPEGDSAFETAVEYLTNNSPLTIGDFQCGGTTQTDIQDPNKLIRSSNTAGTCAVSNPSSANNLIIKNCQNNYAASGPNRVYELYAGTEQGEMSVVVNSSHNITSIRYRPYVLPFDKVDSNAQNPQGNFIGNGARLFGLSAQTGEQKVCSNTDGWLRPCTPIPATPPTSIASSAIVYVSASAEGDSYNQARAQCPVGYKVISGSVECPAAGDLWADTAPTGVPTLNRPSNNNTAWDGRCVKVVLAGFPLPNALVNIPAESDVNVHATCMKVD